MNQPLTGVVLPKGQTIPDKIRIHDKISLWRSDPYPGYAALLAQGPVFLGRGAYIVAGHAAVSAVLKDPRLHMPVPFQGAASYTIHGVTKLRGLPLVNSAMVFSNGADHTRRRAFMTRAFQPRVLAETVPRMRQILDETLKPLARKKSVDIVEHLALPFPVRVIAAMLGVPREDHAQCKVWSEALAPLIDAVITEEGYEAAAIAADEFKAYVQALMNERRARPLDDMITSLTRYLDEQKELGEDEVIANIVTLFVAGHETTTNLLGAAFELLTRFPEQRALLERDPALLEGAIEEILRYEPSVQFTARQTTTALDLEGVHLPAGSPVWIMLAAANRDPARFPEPDRFDVTRSPNPHLSFGAGWHFCLGASLARIEAKEALGAFFARFPRWRLIEENLALRDTMTLRGYRRLQVALK